MVDEIKKEKARKLRYTKPVVKGISREDIFSALYDMTDRCSEAMYLCDTDAETILESLCGDEDDFYQFRMELADTESQIEMLLSDLNEGYVPELFDDFFVTVNDCHEELLGYDSYEEDYYGLNVYEYKYATEESRKRLERHTKKEILDTMAICFNIYTSFLSLRYRYDNLTAALDILREKNLTEIKGASALNDAYEKYNSDGCCKWSASSIELDMVARLMPAEAWLR